MMEPSPIKVPTVNAKEMVNFKKMSTFWWSGHREILPLRTFNQIRVPWIINNLREAELVNKDNSEKPLQGLSVLDVGCGGGFLTEGLAELGCSIVGLDPCPELIQVAKEHLALKTTLSNVTYICGSLEDHVENNYEKYDVVIASEVIDHVDEPDLFLDMCVKCLKQGGSFFLTTFNKTWSAWLKIIISFEYIVKIIPRGTHSWDKFYSPEDIGKRLQKYNCQTKQVQGMHYSYFNQWWNLTSDISVTYGLHAVKDNK